MSFLSYTKPFNENLLMLLLRNHTRYLPIVQFFENMTLNLSELSWGEAELIAAEISRANQSGFCSGIRKGMTKALEVDSSLLQADKLAAALRFALKINQGANGVVQKDINTVLDAGWSEQTVEDIVGLVAIQTLYNVIGNGLGFKQLADGVFVEIGKDTVRNGGYVKSFTQIIDSSI